MFVCCQKEGENGSSKQAIKAGLIYVHLERENNAIETGHKMTKEVQRNFQ